MSMYVVENETDVLKFSKTYSMYLFMGGGKGGLLLTALNFLWQHGT